MSCNLFSKSTAWLPFAFLSPSKFWEFLTFEVLFSISKHAFLHEFLISLALTTFFQNYFHYYCHWYLNAIGDTSFHNHGQVFFLQRDAPTKTFVLLSILLYLFHLVSCTLFLILTLSDFCFWIKHGFLNCFYLNTFYSVLMFLYF